MVKQLFVAGAMAALSTKSFAAPMLYKCTLEEFDNRGGYQAGDGLVDINDDLGTLSIKLRSITASASWTGPVDELRGISLDLFADGANSSLSNAIVFEPVKKILTSASRDGFVYDFQCERL